MSRREMTLFMPDAPRLWTMPAGADFLKELARELYHTLGPDNRLSDAVIYVPNRRSAHALSHAIYLASGKAAILLPDIRTLGDLDSDEAPPMTEAALADLPPHLSPARRLGELARLVSAFFEQRGSTLPLGSALAAARELARLLDQATMSGGVDWGALKALSLERDLAAHWSQSLEFLNIIIEAWPDFMAAAEALDSLSRRRVAAEALAASWRTQPPDFPVIIAGSTGATPASQILMQAALTLPHGLVVLPGLDRATLARGSLARDYSHPQFALSRTMRLLGAAPSDVADWPGLNLSDSAIDRQKLVHEALAPAQKTADWRDRLNEIAGQRDLAETVRGGFAGLSLIDVAHESEEAHVAALLLRETLEDNEATAAVITPDAGLARQIGEVMRRWDIDIAPSAGRILPQTGAGSFAGLVARWQVDPGDAVALMSVLQHPDCRFTSEAILWLDRVILRGTRLWTDLSDLCRCVEAHEDKAGTSPKQTVLEMLSELEAALAAEDCLTVGAWVEELRRCINAISRAPAPWVGAAGAALSSLLEDIADIGAAFGPQSRETWAELFDTEAAAITVAAGKQHPRLVIWGPLEARLQSADHIILAGLNEGVWPAQPPADAFLPRAFREKIGLSDPDERIGLSAHDFAQLACAPKVTLLCAQRRDDKPVVASRWVWRLRMLARGALGSDGADALLAPSEQDDPRKWLRALETAPDIPPLAPIAPRPTPPIAARPDKLSVTRIEQLVRDPYAIYGQYILGLRRLDPLAMPSDTRTRGIAIHKAFERFEEEQVTADPDLLLELIEEELRRGGEPLSGLIALRERRRQVAKDFLSWRASYLEQTVGAPLLEKKGGMSIDLAGRAFRLEGTADRIDQFVDGSIGIIDFKTGSAPSDKQVASGLSPQMPLLGLIAQNGGYDALKGPAKVSALHYLRAGTKFEPRTIHMPGEPKDTDTIAKIIAQAEAGLIALLTQFADSDQPYLSAPIPDRVTYASDYTRLARRDEWAGLNAYD